PVVSSTSSKEVNSSKVVSSINDEKVVSNNEVVVSRSNSSTEASSIRSTVVSSVSSKETNSSTAVNSSKVTNSSTEVSSINVEKAVSSLVVRSRSTRSLDHRGFGIYAAMLPSFGKVAEGMVSGIAKVHEGVASSAVVPGSRKGASRSNAEGVLPVLGVRPVRSHVGQGQSSGIHASVRSALAKFNVVKELIAQFANKVAEVLSIRSNQYGAVKAQKVLGSDREVETQSVSIVEKVVVRVVEGPAQDAGNRSVRSNREVVAGAFTLGVISVLDVKGVKAANKDANAQRSIAVEVLRVYPEVEVNGEDSGDVSLAPEQEVVDVQDISIVEKAVDVRAAQGVSSAAIRSVRRQVRSSSSRDMNPDSQSVLSTGVREAGISALDKVLSVLAGTKAYEGIKADASKGSENVAVRPDSISLDQDLGIAALNREAYNVVEADTLGRDADTAIRYQTGTNNQVPELCFEAVVRLVKETVQGVAFAVVGRSPVAASPIAPSKKAQPTRTSEKVGGANAFGALSFTRIPAQGYDLAISALNTFNNSIAVIVRLSKIRYIVAPRAANIVDQKIVSSVTGLFGNVFTKGKDVVSEQAFVLNPTNANRSLNKGGALWYFSTQTHRQTQTVTIWISSISSVYTVATASLAQLENELQEKLDYSLSLVKEIRSTAGTVFVVPGVSSPVQTSTIVSKTFTVKQSKTTASHATPQIQRASSTKEAAAPAASSSPVKWYNRPVRLLVQEDKVRKNHEEIEAFLDEKGLVARSSDLEGKVYSNNIRDFDIEGYIEALRYFCDFKKLTDVDQDTLIQAFLEFNYLLERYSYTAGELNFESCTEGDVYELFERILSSLNEEKIEKDPILFAAQVFVDVVRYQMFRNGNHRSGDFLFNYITAKNGTTSFFLNTENIIEYYSFMNTKDLQDGNYEIEKIADFFRREIAKNGSNDNNNFACACDESSSPVSSSPIKGSLVKEAARMGVGFLFMIESLVSFAGIATGAKTAGLGLLSMVSISGYWFPVVVLLASTALFVDSIVRIKSGKSIKIFSGIMKAATMPVAKLMDAKSAFNETYKPKGFALKTYPQTMVQNAKKFALLAVGGAIMGLGYGWVGPTIGFVAALVAPYLAMVLWNFFYGYIWKNIKFAEYVAENDDFKPQVSYSSKIENADALQKIGFGISNVILRAQIAFPIITGVMEFVLNRALLVVVGSWIAAPVVLWMGAAADMVLIPAALKGAFVALHLEFTLGAVVHLAVMVLVLNVKKIGAVRTQLQHVVFKAADKKALFETLQEKIGTKETSWFTRMGREVAYYVTFDVAAVVLLMTAPVWGVALTSYSMIRRVLGKEAVKNSYYQVAQKVGQEFYTSVFHMWLISMEIGLVVDAGEFLGGESSAYKNYGGTYVNTFIQALEGEKGALSVGQVIVPQTISGINPADVTSVVISGKTMEEQVYDLNMERFRKAFFAQAEASEAEVRKEEAAKKAEEVLGNAKEAIVEAQEEAKGKVDESEEKSVVVVEDGMVAEIVSETWAREDIFRTLEKDYGFTREDLYRLTLSFVQQESSFNPEAVSEVGATGLMQIMPKTWERIVDELGVDWTFAEAKDPSKNVTVGTTYVAKVMKAMFDRYEDREVVLEDLLKMSAAAYFAGENHVDNKTWYVDVIEDGTKVAQDNPKTAAYAQEVVCLYNNMRHEAGVWVTENVKGSTIKIDVSEIASIATEAPAAVSTDQKYADAKAFLEAQGRSVYRVVPQEIADGDKTFVIFKNREGQIVKFVDGADEVVAVDGVTLAHDEHVVVGIAKADIDTEK
ncbi:transglycosylase SLT domain-containing protein, partial [Candidatus Pacearchaeota archaeon]|nr:transglycosylase SLT domain-containing protein [Candidatus Pacearchaeota archaeon]